MELKKDSSTSRRRHLGWRILLGMIANLGLLTFGKGLGEMLHLWNGPLLWHYVWFSVPYVVLLIVFMIGLAMAVQGYTRTSAVLVLLGLVVSAGLFAYDIANQRGQYRVATRLEDGTIDYHVYYCFWWWWAEWGEICVI